MTDLLIRPETNELPRSSYVADRPIGFETWLTLSENIDSELVKGVILNRIAAHYPHEWIFMWLASILRQNAGKRNLGVVLGSRTAVKTDQYDGRLPDILSVRADNAAIIRKDAIYGAPDVVIEIVSPNNYRSDLAALETDYSNIGVPEIVFIDPQQSNVPLIRKTDAGEYSESLTATGRVHFQSVPGFHIEVEWLFAPNPPEPFDVTIDLLEQAAAE